MRHTSPVLVSDIVTVTLVHDVYILQYCMCILQYIIKVYMGNWSITDGRLIITTMF